MGSRAIDTLYGEKSLVAKSRQHRIFENNEFRLIGNACRACRVVGFDNLKSLASHYIGGCLCDRLDKLVQVYSSTIVALAHCTYNPAELYLQSHGLKAQSLSIWTQAFRTNSNENPPRNPENGLFLKNTNMCLMRHLSSVLHSPDNLLRDDRSLGLLAYSAAGVTIYHKVLLDKECFSKKRQLIQISLGCLSYNSVVRNKVTQDTVPYSGTGDNTAFPRPPRTWGGEAWQLAPHSQIAPHYVGEDFNIEIKPILAESAIYVEFHLIMKNPKSLPYSPKGVFYLDAAYQLLRAQVDYPPCNHDTDSPLQSDSSLGSYVISTFAGNTRDLEDPESFIFYALEGRGIEVVMQMGFLNPDISFLTMNNCLKCTFEAAREKWQVYKMNSSTLTWRDRQDRPKVNIIMT